MAGVYRSDMCVKRGTTLHASVDIHLYIHTVSPSQRFVEIPFVIALAHKVLILVPLSMRHLTLFTMHPYSEMLLCPAA